MCPVAWFPLDAELHTGVEITSPGVGRGVSPKLVNIFDLGV